MTRAKAYGGQAGEPLPTVFKKLASQTVLFRRGQFTLIASAPGVGKSLLSLTLAMQKAVPEADRVPAFYFSADTDAFTMYIRAAAQQTGWSVRDIEKQVDSGNVHTIDAKINGNDHVRWAFDATISFDDIEAELKAFAVTYGEFPALVVIDNLSNIFNESEGQLALESSCDYLHQLARETGAAVIALHHVTGIFDDGVEPVPLSGLRGKISKVPELILTLYRVPGVEGLPGFMGVATVKNRTGKADPMAGMRVLLDMDFERMKLEG